MRRALVLIALAALVPSPARSQILSPGKLSAPHAQLEGLRKCTSCHELRKPGISPTLCLDCHEPLRQRVDRGEGYHASLSEEDCATCHKEHFGRDFALVRLDTASFRHEDAGFLLDGGHLELVCGDCHAPERVVDPTVRRFRPDPTALARTFLGLPNTCTACHEDDDPHAGEFSDRACTACHDTRSWKDAPGFDHDRARYRLTGRHRALECASCHESRPGSDPVTLRFRPLAFGNCTACHQDQHAGAMQGACTTCHSTAGWLPVNRSRVEGRFDHASTGFLLTGRHADVPCASCHDRETAASLPGLHLHYVDGTASRTFPAPESERCTSCHEDEHQGVLADTDGIEACTDCHGQDRWLPVQYDLGRHNAENAFQLEGAHLTVACGQCHRRQGARFVMEVDADSCQSCHTGDNPHGDQFDGRRCDSCHEQTSFAIPEFDHDATGFDLEGVHDELSCAACHRAEPGPGGASMVRYRPLGHSCSDCHGGAS